MGMIGKVVEKKRKFGYSLGRLSELAGIAREFYNRQELDAVRANARYADPKSLTPFGKKIYSQLDEDGIIIEIFARIGVTNKVFVEFGVGDGLENNSLALMFADWTGLWIEGSLEKCAKIRNGFPKTIKSGQLKLINAFITRDNINELISSAVSDSEIDLLSVDIDGNDYHVLQAITCVKPRVIVIEYNAKFPPPIKYCMQYDSSFVGGQTDNQGASLKFLEVRLAARGYSLVGCSLSGVNAFFVRTDLVGDHFLAPYTAEKHYESARYKLVYASSGHKASYQTLENRMLDVDSFVP